MERSSRKGSISVNYSKLYKGEIDGDAHEAGIHAQFLSSLSECIALHLSDQKLQVEDLARHMGMSRTQLYRKIKDITGLGASELITRIRLEASREMLRNPGANIAQVAYRTGFSSPSNFARKFKVTFHQSPREYRA